MLANKDSSVQEKYSMLKKICKQQILENEILKDELKKLNQKFVEVSREREFLLEQFLTKDRELANGVKDEDLSEDEDSIKYQDYSPVVKKKQPRKGLHTPSTSRFDGPPPKAAKQERRAPSANPTLQSMPAPGLLKNRGISEPGPAVRQQEFVDHRRALKTQDGMVYMQPDMRGASSSATIPMFNERANPDAYFHASQEGYESDSEDSFFYG